MASKSIFIGRKLKSNAESVSKKPATVQELSDEEDLFCKTKKSKGRKKSTKVPLKKVEVGQIVHDVFDDGNDIDNEVELSSGSEIYDILNNATLNEEDLYIVNPSSEQKPNPPVTRMSTRSVSKTVRNSPLKFLQKSPKKTPKNVPKRRSRKKTKVVVTPQQVEDEPLTVYENLTSVDTQILVEEDPSCEGCEIRFIIRGKTHKLTMKRNENFCVVIDRIAALLETDRSKVCLSFKNRPISLEKTPDSLGMTTMDSLECFRRHSETNGSAAPQVQDPIDPDAIRIVVRNPEKPRTEQNIVLNLNKFQKIGLLKRMYSEKLQVDVKRLRFEFDGDVLSDSDTPESLDMEDESLVDVRVK
ncbi:hypothetical protein HDE_10118 [Halotydeus destructor]|nr:hypothetical protein HDE_10118 [Halotydeus destructor]